MSNNELIIIPKIEKYTKFKIYQLKERIINELDQYAKHKLKCKYYYRYMDDMVILCENKEKAQNILRSITVFLENNLKLTLNSKTRIFKDIQGVNFCGYKINERRMKIRMEKYHCLKYREVLQAGLAMLNMQILII